MQIGLFFDQTRCSGCYTCILACKQWHENEVESIANWRKVICLESGKFPEVRVRYLLSTCFHCIEPVCAAACPASAIIKREDGVVTVDREACLGRDDCGMLCKLACPYDIPQFADEPGAKMQKCNLCLDRLAEGKNPLCVDACPQRALDFGPLGELERKYKTTREAEGFVYSEKTRPAVVFKVGD